MSLQLWVSDPAKGSDIRNLGCMEALSLPSLGAEQIETQPWPHTERSRAMATFPVVITLQPSFQEQDIIREINQ